MTLRTVSTPLAAFFVLASITSVASPTYAQPTTEGLVLWLDASSPETITLGPDGHFYVANFANGDIVRISPTGEATRFATLPGNNNGHIVFGNGVFYVVARGNHQIYELTLEGELTVIAGNGERGLDDGPADKATLSLPNDVALSPDGRILYWNDVGVTGPDPQTLTPTWIRYVELRPSP